MSLQENYANELRADNTLETYSYLKRQEEISKIDYSFIVNQAMSPQQQQELLESTGLERTQVTFTARNTVAHPVRAAVRSIIRQMIWRALPARQDLRILLVGATGAELSAYCSHNPSWVVHGTTRGVAYTEAYRNATGQFSTGLYDVSPGEGCNPRACTGLVGKVCLCAEECVFRADIVILQHVVYDMDPSDVAGYITRSGAHAAYMSFLMPEEVYARVEARDVRRGYRIMHQGSKSIMYLQDRELETPHSTYVHETRRWAAWGRNAHARLPDGRVLQWQPALPQLGVECTHMAVLHPAGLTDDIWVVRDWSQKRKVVVPDVVSLMADFYGAEGHQRRRGMVNTHQGTVVDSSMLTRLIGMGLRVNDGKWDFSICRSLVIASFGKYDASLGYDLNIGYTPEEIANLCAFVFIRVSVLRTITMDSVASAMKEFKQERSGAGGLFSWARRKGGLIKGLVNSVWGMFQILGTEEGPDASEFVRNNLGTMRRGTGWFLGATGWVLDLANIITNLREMPLGSVTLVAPPGAGRLFRYEAREKFAELGYSLFGDHEDDCAIMSATPSVYFAGGSTEMPGQRSGTVCEGSVLPSAGCCGGAKEPTSSPFILDAPSVVLSGPPKASEPVGALVVERKEEAELGPGVPVPLAVTESTLLGKVLAAAEAEGVHSSRNEADGLSKTQLLCALEKVRVKAKRSIERAEEELQILREEKARKHSRNTGKPEQLLEISALDSQMEATMAYQCLDQEIMGLCGSAKHAIGVDRPLGEVFVPSSGEAFLVEGVPGCGKSYFTARVFERVDCGGQVVVANSHAKNDMRKDLASGGGNSDDGYEESKEGVEVHVDCAQVASVKALRVLCDKVEGPVKTGLCVIDEVFKQDPDLVVLLHATYDVILSLGDRAQIADSSANRVGLTKALALPQGIASLYAHSAFVPTSRRVPDNIMRALEKQPPPGYQPYGRSVSGTEKKGGMKVTSMLTGAPWRAFVEKIHSAVGRGEMPAPQLVLTGTQQSKEGLASAMSHWPPNLRKPTVLTADEAQGASADHVAICLNRKDEQLLAKGEGHCNVIFTRQKETLHVLVMSGSLVQRKIEVTREAVAELLERTMPAHSTFAAPVNRLQSDPIARMPNVAVSNEMVSDVLDKVFPVSAASNGNEIKELTQKVFDVSAQSTVVPMANFLEATRDEEVLKVDVHPRGYNKTTQNQVSATQTAVRRYGKTEAEYEAAFNADVPSAAFLRKAAQRYVSAYYAKPSTVTRKNIADAVDLAREVLIQARASEPARTDVGGEVDRSEVPNGGSANLLYVEKLTKSTNAGRLNDLESLTESFGDAQSFQKQQHKEKAALDSYASQKAGQGIIAYGLTTTAELAPAARAVELSLREKLAPNVILGFGEPEQIISTRVSDEYNRVISESNGKVHMHGTDMAEFDASQTIKTVAMELVIYALQGMAKSEMLLYASLRRKFQARAPAIYKVKGAWVRLSGEPLTLFGNTTVTMCVTAWSVAIRVIRRSLNLFQGDDSTIVSPLRVIYEKLTYSRKGWISEESMDFSACHDSIHSLFGMDTKFEVEGGVPSFCKKFVTTAGLLNDPLNRLARLACKTFKDEVELDQYRVQVNEWISPILASGVAYAAAESCFVSVHGGHGVTSHDFLTCMNYLKEFGHSLERAKALTKTVRSRDHVVLGGSVFVSA